MKVRDLPEDANAALAREMNQPNYDRFRFVEFSLTVHDARRLEVVGADAPYMFHHAANIFDLIATCLSLNTADESHLVSVAEVSALAFRRYADDNAQVLDTLSAAIRAREAAAAPGDAEAAP